MEPGGTFSLFPINIWVLCVSLAFKPHPRSSTVHTFSPRFPWSPTHLDHFYLGENNHFLSCSKVTLKLSEPKPNEVIIYKINQRLNSYHLFLLLHRSKFGCGLWLNVWFINHLRWNKKHNILLLLHKSWRKVEELDSMWLQASPQLCNMHWRTSSYFSYYLTVVSTVGLKKVDWI